MPQTATGQAHAQDNRRPTRNPLEQDGFNEAPITPEVIPATALEAQERASIDIQVATANRYKRPHVLAIQKEIEDMALADDETAGACFYTLKRWDREANEEKIIQDASIRLAEIAIYCWRNIRCGTQIVGNDGLRITAQGVCLDLERNIFVSRTTDRSIASKDGKGGYKTWGLDMQVTTANAASAIALREAVFKVIPKFIIKPVVEKCKRKVAGEGPIEGRWQKTVKAFAPWGITDAMLRAWLKVPLDKPVGEVITDENIVHVRGLFTSLREEETTIQAEFAGINKDGTPKQPGQQQAETKPHAEETKPPTDETKQAGTETKKLSIGDFSAAEQNRLLRIARSHNWNLSGIDQLSELMETFNGTADQFTKMLSRPPEVDENA